MKCDICGKETARVRRVAQASGSGKTLLVIDRIPLVHCSNCGQSYFTAATLHEVEELRASWKELAETRAVRVVQMKPANAALSRDVVRIAIDVAAKRSDRKKTAATVKRD